MFISYIYLLNRLDCVRYSAPYAQYVLLCALTPLQYPRGSIEAYPNGLCNGVLCLQGCGTYGSCVYPGVCQCQKNYTGASCSTIASASCINGNSNGVECLCSPNWSGLMCDVPVCNGVAGCGPNGRCATDFRCNAPSPSRSFPLPYSRHICNAY